MKPIFRVHFRVLHGYIGKQKNKELWLDSYVMDKYLKVIRRDERKARKDDTDICVH